VQVGIGMTHTETWEQDLLAGALVSPTVSTFGVGDPGISAEMGRS
jgi:hypothetical protein